MFVTGVVFMEA